MAEQEDIPPVASLNPVGMKPDTSDPPVDDLNPVDMTKFGPGMCFPGCWEAGKKPDTSDPPVDGLIPVDMTKFGPGMCFPGSWAAGKKPDTFHEGCPPEDAQQPSSGVASSMIPDLGPGACPVGSWEAGKKPDNCIPVNSLPDLREGQKDAVAGSYLGPGTCQVGSLETGKRSEPLEKKRTRRSKKSKSAKTPEVDSLFSLKTMSKIDASFANLCIDTSSGDITIPGNVAGTSNEPSLDPGGKVVKKTRSKKVAVKDKADGAKLQPIPVNIDSAADGTPAVVKKKKRSRHHVAAVASPIPVPMTGETTPKSSPRRQRNRNHGMSPAVGEGFSDYLPEAVVKVGIENKRLLVGPIRINPKNFTEAYIPPPDKGQDILIDGMKSRNRALEGDVVVVQMSEEAEWRSKPGEGQRQKTGVVVYIRQYVHPRVAVGFLKPMADNNPNTLLFSPRDSRVPRIRVPRTSGSSSFLTTLQDYDKQLFLVSIKLWNDTRYAVGEVLDSMGPVGDLKAENTAILLENDLKTEPYATEMYKFFPREPYTILQEEIDKREDLRKSCIFTIDPATARDLDDAMSVEELPNGNVRVGVHISDVSFFVEEGTAFDEEVADRATSTYLVDTVYHMLPRELCMLCSLLPGEDKLAYSVFWEIDAEAQVVSHRFTRSVINSCTQLSYEHAQDMLDNPGRQWLVGELPSIHGGFSAGDLSRVVNHLNRLAVIMRTRRFETGALRINQPKLNFSLDKATGKPTGFSAYVNKESHRLIEEFMLLANITVAERIYLDFPKLAFLRNHLAPHPYLMETLQRSMACYGVHLDVSSAGALMRSMQMYDGEDFPSQARMMVLYARCSKPMARAKYFCSCGLDAEDFGHYALNVPLYTHFTSPIRRYPDIMVHRLLSASLGYAETPKWEPDTVQSIASNCNKKKFSAKRAGEQSCEIYLSLYFGEVRSMLESAVVIDVKDRSFDVIICSMGINQRIYLNKIPVTFKHSVRDQMSKLELTWKAGEDAPSTTQTIEVFVIVTVLVTKTPGQLKVESVLVRPSVSGKTIDRVKI